MAKLDAADLSIELAGTGFVIGSSPLGSVIGPESAERIGVEDQLTSLSINRQSSVDQGLFIDPDVPTMTLTAKFQDVPKIFRDQVIIVTHRGDGVVFRGRVLKAQRSVTLSPDRQQRDFKSWSISILAAPADSKHPKYQIRDPLTYAAGDPASVILERLPYIAQVTDNVGVSDFRVAAGHDEAMTGGELLTRIMRLTSTYIHSDPLNDGNLIIDPYDYGSRWELSDQSWPSFRSMSFSEETSLATAVTLTGGDTVPTPAEGEEQQVSATFTKAVDGAERNDQAFTLDVPFDVAAEQLELAAARMPVVKAPQPEFVSSITIPYDATLPYSQDPTSVQVELDGAVFTAAVIGVSHSISAGVAYSTWNTTLTCAPSALLTRE